MNKIFVVLTLIALLETQTFSNSGDPQSAPSEGFDTGVLAKCIKSTGAVYPLENVNNPVFDNRIYNAKRLNQGTDKRILNTHNVMEWTVDGCKNAGDELDGFASADADPQNFGTGAIKIANLNLIRDVKSKKKAHRFLFVYTTAPDGTPSKYFHADTKTYAVVGLDPSGKMDDNNLRDISGLRITSGLFNMERMFQNIDDVAADGLTKVDSAVLKTQFDGIQQLGTLYTQNINNAKNWLLGLKNAGKYEDLNTQMQTIGNFLSSASVGSAKMDKTKLQDIEKMNIEFSATINKLRLSKDNIRALFNQMDAISKTIPGTEPTSLADRLKNPKKYTIVSRLISDALNDDRNAINIFYALDDWIAKSQSFTDRINELKGVKDNFLPKLNTQISAFIQKLDSVQNGRTKFEKALKNSIAAGKGDVNNAVHLLYDQLRQAIADLEKMSTDLQNLIGTGKNIKDERFQASLAAEVARLTPVFPQVKALSDYGARQMPQEMSDAYSKAQDKTNKPITDVITDATTHIAQLEAALKPTIDRLNANQDANQTYAASKAQISAAQDFLTGDQVKLQKIVTTVTEPQLKNVITTTLSNIDAEKARVAQIEKAVLGSAINDHITKAETIKNSINLPTGDFRKAYNQYVADKSKGTPSTTNVMQEYAKVYMLLQEVVPLLKIDLTTMDAADKRKATVTAYVGPKTVGTSLAYAVQMAANQLLNLGIQVQPPAA